MFCPACIPKSNRGGASSGPPPDAPVITSVTPGSSGAGLFLEFTFTADAWDAFHFQLSTSPSFSPLAQDDSAADPGTVSRVIDAYGDMPLTADTLYYIRVRITLAGATSAW